MKTNKQDIRLYRLGIFPLLNTEIITNKLLSTNGYLRLNNVKQGGLPPLLF